MNLREVYFRTELGIGDLAQTIRSIFRVADMQQRDGYNRGGRYYQFEVFGFTMLLLPNANAAEIPERPDWPYYMIVYTEEVPISDEDIEVVAEYVAAVFRQHSLETTVDCLS